MKRRAFLKGSAAAVGGAAALGFDLRSARAELRELKISRTSETRSTCPYCSVSCGVIIHTLGDRAKNVTAASRARARAARALAAGQSPPAKQASEAGREARR